MEEGKWLVEAVQSVLIALVVCFAIHSCSKIQLADCGGSPMVDIDVGSTPHKE